jgi:uncharacterized iron-regulated membrane protein
MIHLSRTKTKALVAVHGWGGAVLGLLLYAVIVTGTAAVFKREIDIWSAGALQIENPLHRPLDAILRRLGAETPDHYRDDVSVSAAVTGDLSVFFSSARQEREWQCYRDRRRLQGRTGRRSDFAQGRYTRGDIYGRRYERAGTFLCRAACSPASS